MLGLSKRFFSRHAHEKKNHPHASGACLHAHELHDFASSAWPTLALYLQVTFIYMFGGVCHHFERFFQSWNELMLAFARNGKFKVQADFKSVFTFAAQKEANVLQIFHSPPPIYLFSAPPSR